MTGTEIVTDDQDTNEETTDDQDTNEETTVEPDTNEKTTAEFKTNAQTTHRPIDNTTNLNLTTISEPPLINLPDISDKKDIEITFTESPSILTNIDTEPTHTQTNTTAIPSETETQNPFI